MPHENYSDPIIVPTPGPAELVVRKVHDEHGGMVVARLDCPGPLEEGFPYLTMSAIGMPGGGTNMTVGWNDGSERRDPDQIQIEMHPDGSPRILINMAGPGEAVKYAATTIEGLRKIVLSPANGGTSGS